MQQGTINDNQSFGVYPNPNRNVDNQNPGQKILNLLPSFAALSNTSKSLEEQTQTVISKNHNSALNFLNWVDNLKNKVTNSIQNGTPYVMIEPLQLNRQEDIYAIDIERREIIPAENKKKILLENKLRSPKRKEAEPSKIMEQLNADTPKEFKVTSSKVKKTLNPIPTENEKNEEKPKDLNSLPEDMNDPQKPKGISEQIQSNINQTMIDSHSLGKKNTPMLETIEERPSEDSAGGPSQYVRRSQINFGDKSELGTSNISQVGIFNHSLRNNTSSLNMSMEMPKIEEKISEEDAKGNTPLKKEKIQKPIEEEDKKSKENHGNINMVPPENNQLKNNNSKTIDLKNININGDYDKNVNPQTNIPMLEDPQRNKSFSFGSANSQKNFFGHSPNSPATSLQQTPCFHLNKTDEMNPKLSVSSFKTYSKGNQMKSPLSYQHSHSRSITPGSGQNRMKTNNYSFIKANGRMLFPMEPIKEDAAEEGKKSSAASKSKGTNKEPLSPIPAFDDIEKGIKEGPMDNFLNTGKSNSIGGASINLRSNSVINNPTPLRDSSKQDINSILGQMEKPSDFQDNPKNDFQHLQAKALLGADSHNKPQSPYEDIPRKKLNFDQYAGNSTEKLKKDLNPNQKGKFQLNPNKGMFAIDNLFQGNTQKINENNNTPVKKPKTKEIPKIFGNNDLGSYVKGGQFSSSAKIYPLKGYRGAHSKKEGGFKSNLGMKPIPQKIFPEPKDDFIPPKRNLPELPDTKYPNYDINEEYQMTDGSMNSNENMDDDSLNNIKTHPEWADDKKYLEERLKLGAENKNADNFFGKCEVDNLRMDMIFESRYNLDRSSTVDWGLDQTAIFNGNGNLRNNSLNQSFQLPQ
ncbi:MAG: hypothetical protein MJ252_21255 [archaeon]|nr:hypothetical protein [archaeon]